MAQAMTTAEAAAKLPSLENPANGFAAIIAGLFGFFLGFLAGQAVDKPLVGALIGAGIGIAGGLALPGRVMRNQGRLGVTILMAVIGFAMGSFFGLVVWGLTGLVVSWVIYWIGHGNYRKGVPVYATPGQVLWHNSYLFICGAIFFFLIAPILVIIPLSFNAQDFFTFTPEMLRLDPAGYSIKHYVDFVTNSDWTRPFKNSLIIAPFATVIAVFFGTLAAVGLSQSHVPFKGAIMATLISPMIVPLIISATGMFFFYSDLGLFLQNTVGLSQSLAGYIKIILAHAALGVPFVIITVTATLVGFDKSLTRASANMGAGPIRTFFKVQMPLILPGVISGGLFAFITSFDEVVVVIFVASAEQKTLPWQMFTGLREQISPTILAVATVLVAISICLLTAIELLRRRSERLRGLSPG